MTERKKRTKVLFLITKGSWGGAQRYVYDIATNLPYTYNPVVALGGDGMLAAMLDDAGIKQISLPGLQRDVSALAEFRAAWSIIKLVRKERPEVLHLNSSKAGFLGAVLGRLLGVRRIIFTAHAWAFNENRPTWQKVLIKCVHWLTVMATHHTIVVSTGMAKEFTWLGVTKKITVIHPGRDLPDLLPRDEARGRLEMKVQNAVANLHDFEQDLWIGSIAELHKTKQLNRLIDAMAALVPKFPNLRLVLIHDGEERERLEAQVKDLGLEAHVYFTGLIKDAARLLPAFDIFALPSRTEAFGYVLVEAGLASVPVVATSVGGITDIITDGDTGLLVPKENTPALTAALRRLLEEPNLRHELAQANYANVQRFTVAEMIDKTVAVYQPTPQ